ncbi:hypothetical protein DEO72_LG2g5027 [Vigna unguiculata]|uniref:Uncharacterized protein n=2 Tax=Vigna unguiculata TaxID=3917 RepID=A0A4D6L817_VIGUN|nr:hypothetical protein DEO72_LG2g5027 [Vigna unguiculata]
MKLEASGGGCKYHPDNKQVQGVCAFCLRDKLLKLYDINNPTYPLPSPSQPFSSYMSHRHHHHHRRHASSVADSVSSVVGFNYGLKKSNSIAFGSGSRNTDKEVNENSGGSKKKGVWSKLLKLTRKNSKEAFMHSRTVREGKSLHF